jgi:hypothetical protein
VKTLNKSLIQIVNKYGSFIQIICLRVGWLYKLEMKYHELGIQNWTSDYLNFKSGGTSIQASNTGLFTHNHTEQVIALAF